MKKMAITFLPVFILISSLCADGGSCLFYQAKFYLKNGTIIKGGFEVFGESTQDYCMLNDNGNNPYCSDEGILKLVKKLQREGFHPWPGDGGIQKKSDYGKLPVYKNMYYLSPRSLKKRSNDNHEWYGFLTENDIVFVDSSEIKKVVFWSAEYSERYWLTSGIVVGTTGMIDTVRNKAYWNSIVVSMDNYTSDSLEIYEEPMAGYRLINYNPGVNIEGLKQYARLKFHPRMEEKYSEEFMRKHRTPTDEKQSRELDRLREEMFERKIQLIRLWFWKKGIVMIRINGTC